jgi:predicted N-formylglutamate amidohydrolase
VSEVYRVVGSPKQSGVFIVADHSSNHVPSTIDLGISRVLLEQHIAWDIGVATVAELLTANYGFSGILGGVSRLVVDLNRYCNEAAAIPVMSDGIELPGNILSQIEREKRIERYYEPYHDALSSILTQTRPALILSLHSFTPQMQSKPNELRPWEIGVLYNNDDRAARIAIPLLEQAGLFVGDQQPYSGTLLNATMNRHAEDNGIPYLGIEMRQDLVADAVGYERFTSILGPICHIVAEKLALSPSK